MTRRVLRLTLFELRKLTARRLPVLAFVLVVLIALLAPTVGHAVDTASSLMKGKVGQSDGWKNGWTAMASAVSTARLFVFIVVLILAGSTVAEEASHATLKTLFTRPVRRVELLLGKALAQEELTGLGLLASCLSDHPGHATGGAIGALFFLSGVAGVAPDWLRDATFVTYSAAPFEVVDALANQFAGEKEKLALPAVVKAVSVSAAWAAAGFGLSAWLLGRRDIGG